jgi:hypothetical protein
MSNNTNAAEKNRPVTEIREGTVKIAIWKHQGEDGPYYTAGKPQLSWRDKDGKWHNDTASYGGFDLVNLATAALKARAEIARLKRTDKPEAAPDEEAA